MRSLAARALLALVTLLAASCVAPPSQHDEALYGTVTVAHRPGARPRRRTGPQEQRAEITEEIATLSRARPDGHARARGRRRASSVRPFASPDCARTGAGRYTHVARATYEIDPACVGGALKARGGARVRALAHVDCAGTGSGTSARARATRPTATPR
jgi:hypothetical protein